MFRSWSTLSLSYQPTHLHTFTHGLLACTCIADTCTAIIHYMKHFTEQILCYFYVLYYVNDISSGCWTPNTNMAASMSCMTLTQFQKCFSAKRSQWLCSYSSVGRFYCSDIQASWRVGKWLSGMAWFCLSQIFSFPL